MRTAESDANGLKRTGKCHIRMKLFIIILRIFAVFFNSMMALISYDGHDMPADTPKSVVTSYVIFFGGQALLGLMPFRKIHESKLMTRIFICITGFLPALMSPVFIGTLFGTDVKMVLFAFVMLPLLWSTPLLLLLEHHRYKSRICLTPKE